ncbi:hypothetical protein [Nonomuraea jabiensis]|uniref:hypothetical protein n=1 Tax=Nonomuraea jabiensis TaxID=882448 RepID=UPI003D70F270
MDAVRVVPQLVSIVVIVALLVVAAFRLPRPGRAAEWAAEWATEWATGRAPSPWLVLGAALVAGLVFELQTVIQDLPVWLTIAGLVAAEAGIAWLALTWSAREGWDGRHRMALAGGALLTYAWHAFFSRPLVPSSLWLDLASHLVFGLGAVALLVVALQRAKSNV